MGNLTFFFSFIDSDFPLACHLVEQINRYYPEAMILAVGDGASKENKLDCICWFDQHLKKPGTIGHFTQRNFQFILDIIAIDNSIESVIKLDPDSFVKERPFTLPQEDWAGEVNFGRFSWGESSWAKGGVYCIKKRAIQAIVDSQLLLDVRLQQPEPFEVREGRIYEDFRLGYVANQLGIYPVRWPDVSAGLVSYKSRLARRFSILHPAKDKLTYFP